MFCQMVLSQKVIFSVGFVSINGTRIITNAGRFAGLIPFCAIVMNLTTGGITVFQTKLIHQFDEVH